MKVQIRQGRATKALGKAAHLIVKEVKALSSFRQGGCAWEPFTPFPYRKSFHENYRPWKVRHVAREIQGAKGIRGRLLNIRPGLVPLKAQMLH